PRYVLFSKRPMRRYLRGTASDCHEPLAFGLRPVAPQKRRPPDGGAHERHPNPRRPYRISAATQVRPRQRTRATQRRELCAVLREDRKNLRTRASDTSRLLQRPVFRRTRKDGDDRPLESRKESVMKCAHPTCNRGIGLVSHRRSFSKGLYCSRRCRDNYAAAKPRTSDDARLFAWLFVPMNAPAQRRLVPATVRAPPRPTSFRSSGRRPDP